ncbi:MAG: hypothetical protein K6U89_04515 [Chloroflexi bacterium]|nr:hypothetical protein [Chloroflexota bacterium]
MTPRDVTRALVLGLVIGASTGLVLGSLAGFGLGPLIAQVATSLVFRRPRQPRFDLYLQ